MQNKFAIGIPTYNRIDLLHPALLFMRNDFPTTKIFIVDNGNQGVASRVSNLQCSVHESEGNIGVAASWNKLCDDIFVEHDYAVILNDDIYFGRKDWELDSLLTNYKGDLYLSTQDWCAFILPKKTYLEVGRFDANFFPAYYEDNDYAYRMRLMGKSIFKLPFLNPFVYKSSQTISKDPALKKACEGNKEMYIRKWGGEPNSEKFKTPYNKA